MTILIFDTSTLRETQKSSLEPLEKLCTLEVITLIIPEIVIREYTTGVLRDAIIPSSVRKHLRRACNWLNKDDTDKLNVSLKELENFSKNGEELVDKGVREWLWKIHGQIEPFSSTNLAHVFSNYFSGNPPFSGPKSRTDLPDAIVFDSVRRASKRDTVVALISDTRLKKACESLKKVFVFPSLHSFYSSEMFASLRISAEEMLEEIYEKRLEIEQVRLNQIKQLLSKQITQIRKMIEPRLYDELQGTEFTGDFLGVDTEIVIDKLTQIYDISFDWESSILIASDIISVHITITLNALVESLSTRRKFPLIPNNIESHHNVIKFDWDDNILWIQHNTEITVEGIADFRIVEYDDNIPIGLEGLQSLIIDEIYETD